MKNDLDPNTAGTCIAALLIVSFVILAGVLALGVIAGVFH